MTIAGAVAQFYFAKGDGVRMPRCPIWRAFWVTAIYHLGTVAIGSFILAVVLFIKYVLVLVQRHTRWFTGWSWVQRWLKYLVAVLVCLVWVIEQIVKFINR